MNGRSIQKVTYILPTFFLLKPFENFVANDIHALISKSASSTCWSARAIVGQWENRLVHFNTRFTYRLAFKFISLGFLESMLTSYLLYNKHLYCTHFILQYIHWFARPEIQWRIESRNHLKNNPSTRPFLRWSYCS